MPNNKSTKIGMSFAKTLAEKGYRIFDIDTARKLGVEGGIKPSYMKECLYLLKKQGWITPLKTGWYALCPALLSGNPISEYEIAMSIADPASICYWSAMHYHQITQQIPHKIFVLTTTDAKFPKGTIGKNREILIDTIHYHFLSVKREHYFGIKVVWIGAVRINITDLERTLIDGLTKPKYCGGFFEVIEAFRMAGDKIDINKIKDYAQKIGISVTRRLGWMLEYIGVLSETIKDISEHTYSGYIKLDPSEENKGNFNKKWGVRENI